MVEHKNRKHSFTNNFKLSMDEETGDIVVIGASYRFNKTIILSMEELPDRYKSFFTQYILTKDR